MNPQTPPDRNAVAFCQSCGKALTADERRIVAQAVFCEPCLAERLAAAPPPPSGSYAYPGAAGSPASSPYNAAAPFPPTGATPNPGLAALLGFIPGVGAMYNGQYAKGIVHLIVFAILVSLSDQHGIFHLFVMGWVIYQVIEAHQTARARRDGTPLPNPFGLNDVAERLGFGRSWAAATPIPNPAQNPAQNPVPNPAQPPLRPNPSSSNPPSPDPSAAPETPRPAYDWEGYAWEQSTGYRAGQPRPDPATAPFGAQPMPPYTSVPLTGDTPTYDPSVAPPNRFPTGALWLIGLGVLFLIGNAGIFHGFPVYRLLPFLLIGGGLWLFIHRMTISGPSLSDDGSPEYRRRLLSALRASVWIILTGILFFLDMAHILSWGRSWPLWIILAGIMTFLQRTVPPAPLRMPGPYAYPPATTPSPFPATPNPATPNPAAQQPAAQQPAPTTPPAAPHDDQGRQL